MTVFQIIIALFAAFACIRVFVRYVQSDISFKEWLWWTVFWIAVGIAAALPQTTDQLAQGVGLETGRGVDLAVYMAIPVLFYIIFRLYSKIDRIEKSITELTREVAIRNVKKSNTDKTLE
ncbi:MAG: DUF2304 domain-containing protein [Patescibacteria group bacterium]